MNSDRELLELAAKAAGYEVTWVDKYDAGLTHTYLVPLDPKAQYFVFSVYPHKKWNPLADDGDALRLAVKLRIYLTFTGVCTYAEFSPVGAPAIKELVGKDRYAATRRAIVRAAAEIGRAHG